MRYGEIGPLAAVIHYSGATPHDVPLPMGLHSILIGVRGIAFPFVATLILSDRHYWLSLGTGLLISAMGTLLSWRLLADERTEMEAA
jgi:hypothetical protein